MRRALGFDAPFPTLSAALAHHGFIQIDPINVCGRMHDLILRNRVRDYRAGALHEFLHSSARPGFEHYLPGRGILVAFPLTAWPFLTGRMQRREFTRNLHSGRFTPREAKLADHILATIAARGPLTSDDFEHDGRARSAWGTQGTLTKCVLEKLFAHGRLLITSRRNFRRVYDLAERVLPPAVLAAPARPEPEVRRWLVAAKLRQRRLVPLTRAELHLVGDDVQAVTIDGTDCPTLYCLREDAGHLEGTASPAAAPAGEVRLVAPLDPLIYDRRVTRGVWDFNYTWEVYTPAAQRLRGYYALPVLAGTELAGHIDPKADRGRSRLTVVSRRVRRGVRTRGAVADLAGFLGLK
ncbi:MAG: YcaQ family DNA glycosylase [Verrucomicrobia bacterium]|nr:YcaQ family DNA glycosylase [Verrucomicrobiota bacterium]